MKQDNVQKQIDFATAIRPHPESARSASLKVFLCPADDTKGMFDSGASTSITPRTAGVQYHPAYMMNVPNANYLGVWGTVSLIATASPSDDPFSRDSRTRLADITDGTSTTFLLGERSSDLGFATWVEAPGGGFLEPRRPGTTLADRADRAALVLGRTSVESGRGPNSPANKPEDFASRHIGGVQFALADESIRFVPDSIQPAVYAAIATRAGGEIASEP